MVAVWFAAAGLVGAVVWWQATTLPRVERIGDGAALAPGQLVRQVGIDGWFFVIAAVGGLLSAVVLLAWQPVPAPQLAAAEGYGFAAR